LLNNRIRKKKLRHRFFVTVRVGHNFAGVLLAEDRDQAVFGGVTVYPPETEPEKVVGDVYIRHDNVAYTQLVPDADG
jgi:hypothetical protein